ncbi:MAG: hypothetical protein BMS9Abin36_0482 [Gammaproteobacteria bacterium]|nr:MAG: hypothetical protein BMS9Abin36_0482 [Gammaproteobacteria bacterium]
MAFSGTLLSRKAASSLLTQHCRATIPANEGFLRRRDGVWAHHRDTILLIIAHKASMHRVEITIIYLELECIPSESGNQYSSNIHQLLDQSTIFVKGTMGSASNSSGKIFIPGMRPL